MKSNQLDYMYPDLTSTSPHLYQEMNDRAGKLRKMTCEWANQITENKNAQRNVIDMKECSKDLVVKASSVDVAEGERMLFGHFLPSPTGARASGILRSARGIRGRRG